MNRILALATLGMSVSAASLAQQSVLFSEKPYSRLDVPVIERTESVIYEKRVTEKRLGNSAVTTPAIQPVADFTVSADVEAPVLERASTVTVSRNGQPVVNPVTVPAAPDQSELRALRLAIEAQGRKIDSIQTELAYQKQVAILPAAQNNQPQAPKAIKQDNVSIGVYVGPNFSKYSTDQDSLDSKARVGYQIGAYVRGGGRLFGQLGVEYVGVSSKLYSKEDKGTSLNQISSTINTHYIQVPVQIGFRPAMTQSKRTGIRIQAGGELSYLLNTDKNDLKLTDDDFNKTVINLIGGIGFDLGPVTLDVAYHHGIKDAYKNENAKLRMVSASLGFKF